MRTYIYTNDYTPETVDMHSLMYTEPDQTTGRPDKLFVCTFAFLKRMYGIYSTVRRIA